MLDFCVLDTLLISSPQAASFLRTRICIQTREASLLLYQVTLLIHGYYRKFVNQAYTRLILMRVSPQITNISLQYYITRVSGFVRINLQVRQAVIGKGTHDLGMQKTDVRNKGQDRAFCNDFIGFAFGQNSMLKSQQKYKYHTRGCKKVP